MPTYNLTAINIGGFSLGESDKVVSMFSTERGLVRAVAKGAKKPGTKMAGKSEALCVNNLLIAKGRSLDIITQAESIDTFRKLRVDLVRLTFGLYYAELTQAFAEGLEEDSALYYQTLFNALKLQERAADDARLLALEFGMALLRQLGFSPELTVCVRCRHALTEYNITAFYPNLGGIACNRCGQQAKAKAAVSEIDLTGYYSTREKPDADEEYEERGIFVTPLVWKLLVSADACCDELAADLPEDDLRPRRRELSASQKPALDAAHRLLQRYLEDRAGKHMRSLDLLKQI
ncbi:MAG: DNA repair protein RecO [Candidatus Obscuribacterales bacterium]|nr:DNA repair protein RecO [Candidatus Obscuribacterales bacterium]